MLERIFDNQDKYDTRKERECDYLNEQFNEYKEEALKIISKNVGEEKLNIVSKLFSTGWLEGIEHADVLKREWKLEDLHMFALLDDEEKFNELFFEDMNNNWDIGVG